MTDDLTHPSTVSRDILDAAASVCCRRFGYADDEARRRSWVAVLAHASVEMAEALRAFAHAAVQHGNGIHSSPDMSSEARRLADTFEAWSLSASIAAAQRSECADEHRLITLDLPHVAASGVQAGTLS